ncbi:hypothetical protein [Campylobacter jejuni]|uniref:hypothetical protein n=1 Tax=Campylobacter jejuni TaxID=197 RepID=UPI00207D5BBF|nr:hypothetical protein [Campylobacter jejuni]
MKIILVIVFTLFSLVFLSACSFKAKEASELENLTRNYGGIYIFDKKIREEILENERKRTELENDDKFRTKIGQLKSGELIYKIDSTAVDKLLPQVLSNGCKYYRDDYNYDVKDPDYDFNFDDKPEFAYYEDQFKAYMGEETYKKLRPGLTKDKTPNELDKIDEESKQEYLKNKEFRLIKNIKQISYNKTIYLY